MNLVAFGIGLVVCRCIEPFTKMPASNVELLVPVLLVMVDLLETELTNLPTVLCIVGPL